MSASGVSAFAPRPAPIYRYTISTHAEKVTIRLEDRTTKKQWSTGLLDEKEYLTSTNKIPNATLEDYIQFFHDTLGYLMENQATKAGDSANHSVGDDEVALQQLENQLDPGKIRRTLTSLEDGTLQLELLVKIRILRSAWTAKYSFKLEPVSLERIDVLEAKLHDTEEELVSTRNNLEARLRNVEKELESAQTKLGEEERARISVEKSLHSMNEKLTRLEKAVSDHNAKPVAHVRAVSRGPRGLNDKGHICWTWMRGIGFELSSDGYGIRFLQAGWYSISVNVGFVVPEEGAQMQLLKNGTHMQSMRSPYTGNQKSGVSLTYNTCFNRNDKIAVLATGSPQQVWANLSGIKIGE